MVHTMKLEKNFLILDQQSQIDFVVSNLKSPYFKMILSFQNQLGLSEIYIPDECLNEIKNIIKNFKSSEVQISRAGKFNFRLKNDEFSLFIRR